MKPSKYKGPKVSVGGLQLANLAHGFFLGKKKK
jgi:hypothetical protein